MTGRIFRQMFTGIDNVTFDLGRALWAAVVAAYILFTAAAAARGAVFDPTIWSAGAGFLLASGAGSLRLKAAVEPPR